MNDSTTKSLAIVNKEIAKELADPAIGRALLATTFKGLSEQSMKQAIFEGMTRGFKFKDFLEKNVYAIPYGQAYSLVTSIDYARKIGMRSGIVGKSAPSFEMDGKKIVACSITVKRKVSNEIGEWTATVYFDEFTTGKNLWNSKPRTMIAKVAEMHALRMSCPEEMSQVYTAEEFDKEREIEGDYDQSPVADDVVVISTGDDTQGIEAASEFKMPTSDIEKKALLLKEMKRLVPELDTEDGKAVKLAVEDLTELDYNSKNFANIIHLLMKK